MFLRVDFRRPSANELGAEWVELRKKDREIPLHAGQCKRAAGALAAFEHLPVYLVFILREYLVLVKCQFFYIKWVQISRSFPFCGEAQIPLISQLFRAQGGLAPCRTLELDLYWYQDAK